MPRPTRLQISQSDIVKFFDEQDRHVFAQQEIARFLVENRRFWRLATNTGTRDFIEFLCARSHMMKIELESPEYRGLTRFVWREASPFEIALSLRGGSYLSHYSALSLHGLTDQILSTIYVNKEQSPKPSGGELSQGAINRAFFRPQRESRYRFSFANWTVVILSGKNTGDLEVTTVTGPAGETVRVTGLERTLIDIAVRPAYAGGVFEVLQAFERARDSVSISKLVAVLKTLDYIYPYHQVIGFYMKRAGYEGRRLAQLKKLGLDFDFYLTHDLGPSDFDPEWRLFFPKGM